MTDRKDAGRDAGDQEPRAEGNKVRRRAPGRLPGAGRRKESANGRSPAGITSIEDLSDEELQSRRDSLRVQRDSGGRFRKGTPSPNPRGAPTRQRRMYGKSQAIKDVLELFEQPVPMTKGKVTKQVPAIVAIYERMIHMAAQGDWPAIKKCVELRERYADFREQTLAGLLEQAQACRQLYKDYGEDMPDHVKNLVEYCEERAMLGQFEAG